MQISVIEIMQKWILAWLWQQSRKIGFFFSCTNWFCYWKSNSTFGRIICTNVCSTHQQYVVNGDASRVPIVNNFVLGAIEAHYSSPWISSTTFWNFRNLTKNPPLRLSCNNSYSKKVGDLAALNELKWIISIIESTHLY